MHPVIAHAEWRHDEVFEAVCGSGGAIVLDGGSGHRHGPCPMEAVLMALCSCASIEVVNILLKKRQPLTGLRVTASAGRADSPPRVFSRILLTYAVRGRVSRRAVEHAVELSQGKYCAVSKMLEKTAIIECRIIYPEGEPEP